MRRIDRPLLFGLLAWTICGALYFWTASGVSIAYGDRQNAWHHYDYLVEGFLAGHLHVSIEPPPELLRLPDPYDPAHNAAYRLWDASLYHGEYYLYYGPTPALLLIQPAKLLTGRMLPEWAATAAFAVAGLGALTLLLAGVQRRYFPATGGGTLFWAVVLAGHLSWLPVILRRSAFWELPIVAAAALFWWALYFLWKYHQEGGRRPWAIAGGTALAFVLGARPTYLFASAAVVLLFALPFRRRESLPRLAKRLLPAAVPLALGGFGLLAYNYLRFGRVLEFGQDYQLWGIDYRGQALFSLSNFPTNVWIYFFTLPELSPYFPFLRTVWLEGLPAGYLGMEEMPGVLFTLPALLVGMAAIVHAVRRRSDPGERPLRVLLLAAGGGGALTGALLFCFGGSCSRYITELLAGWTVVAAVGLFAIGESTRAPRAPGGLLRKLTGAAVAWSLVATWLASFEFRAFARTTEPVFYRHVAETLNYPSYWVARATGQVFGPVLLDVRLAAAPEAGPTVLLAAGRPDMMDRLVLERFPGDRVRLSLRANDRVLVTTPILPAGGPRPQLRCSAPWLYPPSAHPFWNRYPAPERAERQTLFAIDFGGMRYERQSQLHFDATRFEPFFDSTRFEPFVRTAAADSAGGAWVEKITRADARPAAANPARPAS